MLRLLPQVLCHVSFCIGPLKLKNQSLSPFLCLGTLNNFEKSNPDHKKVCWCGRMERLREAQTFHHFVEKYPGSKLCLSNVTFTLVTLNTHSPTLCAMLSRHRLCPPFLPPSPLSPPIPSPSGPRTCVDQLPLKEDEWNVMSAMYQIKKNNFELKNVSKSSKSQNLSPRTAFRYPSSSNFFLWFCQMVFGDVFFPPNSHAIRGFHGAIWRQIHAKWRCWWSHITWGCAVQHGYLNLLINSHSSPSSPNEGGRVKRKWNDLNNM